VVTLSARRLVAALVCCAVMQGCAASSGAADDRIRKIAILRSVAAPGSPTDAAFLAELEHHGFVAGRNLAVLGGSDNEVFPDPRQATAAVERWEQEGVEVIVAFSTASAEIARDHAPGAKVLFLVNDPQAAGFVEDEQKPEGRMTGVTFRIPADRMLSLARRMLPGLQTAGLPFPPDDPAAIPNRDRFVEAAAGLGLELATEEFSGEADLARAVGVLVQERRAQLLLASVSPTATRALPALAAASTSFGVPYVANVETAEGALMTLSPDGEAIGEQLGRQAVRLLNGATPSSVPVEDPRRFRMTINDTVARSLGMSIPPAVLREADVVRR
jgi:putative tryptophan/tyrosine transport system substrate-binding protein